MTDEHGNPIQLPPGCKCPADSWVTQPHPICEKFQPAPERGTHCAQCEHDEVCHGKA